MKKSGAVQHILIVLFTFLYMGWTSAEAAPLLRFKISRSYCVFNFLETCKGANGTSEALKQYIEANTLGDISFNQLIVDYKSLNFETTFSREGFPETRPAYFSLKDLLIIAAVQCSDLSEFKIRIVGLLHNTDYNRLITFMEKANVYYEQIIWRKYRLAALKQLKELEKYQSVANNAFLKLKTFYNSSWGDDMPFTIALTPVPGKDGSTAATPHANSLCIDVPTEETNYAKRVAIVLHEICHVLYSEQTLQFQHELESYFTGSSSLYSKVAHNFFDEGMATACGNGWTYQFLTKKVDTAAWYSDPYIDGFGHSLLPLVRHYLLSNKPIDSSFISEAIRLFGENFPKSTEDYGIQFNHLTMYSDEEGASERSQIKQTLHEQFTVSWLNFSTPIKGKESVAFLKESDGTQFIIVDRNRDEEFSALKNILPELKGISYNLDEDFVINYYDTLRRLIVIANIRKGETSKLFRTLKKRQFMDAADSYWNF